MRTRRRGASRVRTSGLVDESSRARPKKTRGEDSRRDAEKIYISLEFGMERRKKDGSVGGAVPEGVLAAERKRTDDDDTGDDSTDVRNSAAA
mmetsp:Transcript_39874/g.120012  ORF Transcript_39874/g.120012 Transcript_39874/m.120012 type:complete len:92 (+) Transcript_39874:278-553(+)